MDEVFSYIPDLLFGMCWHPTHPEGMSGIPVREWASRLCTCVVIDCLAPV